MSKNPSTIGTLGGKYPHIYVTRTATLAYQSIIRGTFEQARRALTQRLLRARPETTTPGVFTVDMGSAGQFLRAWVKLEDQLLIVVKVESITTPLRDSAPMVHSKSSTLPRSQLFKE